MVSLSGLVKYFAFCVPVHFECAVFPSAFVLMGFIFVGKCEVFVRHKNKILKTISVKI